MSLDDEEMLADRLARTAPILVFASLLGFGVIAAIVYPLGLSRLWLVAGAIVIGAIEITIVAWFGRPTASSPTPTQPVPVSSGPRARAY